MGARSASESRAELIEAFACLLHGCLGAHASEGCHVRRNVDQAIGISILSPAALHVANAHSPRIRDASSRRFRASDLT